MPYKDIGDMIFRAGFVVSEKTTLKTRF